MRLALLTLLAMSSIATIRAQMAGDAAAKAACVGFPTNAMKCLTDASFVVCGQPSAGTEHEQTVPLGTHCLQGEPGIKVDAIIGSPATTTRVFTHASDFNAPKYTNSTGAATGSATAYGTRAVTGTGSVGNSAADTSGAAATKAISTVLPSMGSTGFATSALATGAGFAPSDGAWVASPISDASSALKVSAASLLVV